MRAITVRDSCRSSERSLEVPDRIGKITFQIGVRARFSGYDDKSIPAAAQTHIAGTMSERVGGFARLCEQELPYYMTPGGLLR